MLKEPIRIPQAEKTALAERIITTLEETSFIPCPPPEEQSLASEITGETFTHEERKELLLESLINSFKERYRLLADSITTNKVQELLHAQSRQTPLSRAKNNTLLAVKDNGVWKYPLWQFDPEGEDGVINGLIPTLKALDISNIAKVAWLSSSNSHFEGLTPLEMLKQGRVEEVVTEAQGVGN